MPQLDFSFYISQFFWFLFTFGAFFAVIAKVVYPRIELSLSYREEAIKQNTKATKALLDEAEFVRQEQENLKVKTVCEVEKVSKHTKKAIKTIKQEEEDKVRSVATAFVIEERARIEKKMLSYSSLSADGILSMADIVYAKFSADTNFLPSSIDGIMDILDVN